jgi:hypothetical protein
MFLGNPGNVHRVAFKSPVNGLYVCADHNAGNRLFANREWHNVWETFEVRELGNGEVWFGADGRVVYRFVKEAIDMRPPVHRRMVVWLREQGSRVSPW